MGSDPFTVGRLRAELTAVRQRCEVAEAEASMLIRKLAMASDVLKKGGQAIRMLTMLAKRHGELRTSSLVQHQPADDESFTLDLDEATNEWVLRPWTAPKAADAPAEGAPGASAAEPTPRLLTP